ARKAAAAPRVPAPDRITRQQLLDWVAQLGFDGSTLRSLWVDRGEVAAEVYTLDANGRKFSRNGEPATHMVTIRIEEGA
ncbi:MAG TPA: hypothetical protein VK988_03130, partial [Acidimicrobiales bacterium]|nr:hypothetical protein [Acidimicrobiales bacterium]